MDKPKHIHVLSKLSRLPKNSDNDIIIDVTSRSPDVWCRQLSPFYLGSVNLYDTYVSYNVENAWQYSKVYKQFIDVNGDPTMDYFVWEL